MAELSLDEKCKLASELLVQSPPGEVNDVINDIRTIIADDEALMPFIAPKLRAYNLVQLSVIEHPEADGVPSHPSILSEAAIVPGSSEGKERYADPVGKRSFAFDHITMTASEYEPYQLPEEEETFRAELAKSLAAYTKNHFPSGHSAVSCSQYPLLPPTPPPAESPVAAEAPVQAAEATPEEPVTDVVDEQVASGEAEPAPTPAVGDVDAKQEEVVQEGGLEKVDEKVEEAKEEEEAAEMETHEPEPTEKASEAEEVKAEGKVIDEPKVEEVAGQTTDEPTAAAEEVAAIPERKQERVEHPTYTLEVVGNRYKPSNFWTGRWRTRWTIDTASALVSGQILVDVHYYEQGNVQLTTSHSATFPLPSAPKGDQSVASQVVTSIAKLETAYQLEMNDVYGELGDKAFRALRRALPVTRQKMEWENVSGYSLGADLTKARA